MSLDKLIEKKNFEKKQILEKENFEKKQIYKEFLLYNFKKYTEDIKKMIIYNCFNIHSQEYYYLVDPKNYRWYQLNRLKLGGVYYISIDIKNQAISEVIDELKQILDYNNLEIKPKELERIEIS